MLNPVKETIEDKLHQCACAAQAACSAASFEYFSHSHGSLRAHCAAPVRLCSASLLVQQHPKPSTLHAPAQAAASKAWSLNRTGSGVLKAAGQAECAAQAQIERLTTMNQLVPTRSMACSAGKGKSVSIELLCRVSIILNGFCGGRKPDPNAERLTQALCFRAAP